MQATVVEHFFLCSELFEQIWTWAKHLSCVTQVGADLIEEDVQTWQVLELPYASSHNGLLHLPWVSVCMPLRGRVLESGKSSGAALQSNAENER